MMDNLVKALQHPGVASVGGACGAVLASFFNVNIFYAIFVMVMFDFITGIYKAAVAKKIRSSKFGRAGERIVYYILMFIPLHMMSLAFPMLDLADDVVMGVFLSRELLSILENLKVISVIKGWQNPYMDQIIHWVGIDVPLLLEEALPHPKNDTQTGIPTQPKVEG